MDQVAAELPRYVCHKRVWALKIKEVAKPLPSGDCMLTPEDDGYEPVIVDAAYMRKHNPLAGGYYVVYEDGYKSFSPAEAFEGGYLRI